jgi:hypothetical protein
VNPSQIEAALADITAERDPTIKHLKLASLVSTPSGGAVSSWWSSAVPRLSFTAKVPMSPAT